MSPAAASALVSPSRVQCPSPRLRTWVESLQGLSVRARRLLLQGDVEGQYRGRNAGDGGYRLTMALAVAVSQPGREWTPAQWYEALVLRPTAGGMWARGLRARKGDRRCVCVTTIPLVATSLVQAEPGRAVVRRAAREVTQARRPPLRPSPRTRILAGRPFHTPGHRLHPAAVRSLLGIAVAGTAL